MTRIRAFSSVLAVAFAFALVVGGCSGGSEDSSSGASVDSTDDFGGAERGVSSEQQALDESSDADGSGGAEGVPDALLTNVGRDVIYTATLDVAVEETDAARTEVVGFVEASGGYVFNQDASFDEESTAVITVKVPPAALDDFLDRVSGVGDVVELTTSADDVTGQVADLDSRITSAARSVERVRGFLDEANDVVQLSTVESELTRRETELERLVAQREQLGSRVDMATVTVTLRPVTVVAAAAADDGLDIPGFSTAFATAIDVVQTGGLLLAAAAGFLLPVLALAAVVLLPLRFVRNRFARS